MFFVVAKVFTLNFILFLLCIYLHLKHQLPVVYNEILKYIRSYKFTLIAGIIPSTVHTYARCSVKMCKITRCLIPHNHFSNVLASTISL